jgi:hypothetical protein
MNEPQRTTVPSTAEPREQEIEQASSETAQLFIQVLGEITEDLPSEEAAEYLHSLFEDEELQPTEHLLFERITTEDTSHLTVPNYHPDRAVREASLAKKELWKPNGEGELSYRASNELEVYLGTPGEPMKLQDALRAMRKLSESTVLTARIILGLWSIRRYNNEVSQDGKVAILLDEILQWQGLQKHTRASHTGTGKRYTDGYRAEQKQRTLQDIALLASCYVRGTCNITILGKAAQIEVNGPYLHYDIVSRKTMWGDKIILGFLVTPGGWIGTYELHQNSSFAQIDRQIFQLNPHNDRHALRIALYLVEHWREQVKEGTFSTPFTMADLLSASMIDVDKRRLTTELAPAIEKALLKLEQMGIVSKHICLTGFHVGVDDSHTHTCMKMHQQPEQGQAPPASEMNPCLRALAYDQARWGKEWLASQWEILPPPELIHSYQLPQFPPRRYGRRLAKKEPPPSTQQADETPPGFRAIFS